MSLLRNTNLENAFMFEADWMLHRNPPIFQKALLSNTLVCHYVKKSLQLLEENCFWYLHTYIYYNSSTVLEPTNLSTGTIYVYIGIVLFRSVDPQILKL